MNHSLESARTAKFHPNQSVKPFVFSNAGCGSPDSAWAEMDRRRSK